MMHQCTTGELLTMAALVHHDDKCQFLAKSVLKGLKGNNNMCVLVQSRSDFIQLMSNAKRGEETHDKADEAEVEKLDTDTTRTGRLWGNLPTKGVVILG